MVQSIDKDSNRKIQSVEVGFDILRAIAQDAISHGKSSVSLAELSRATNLHKSQLYRYLNTFVDLGILLRHVGDVPRWSLGPELIGLGRVAADSQDVLKYAMPTVLDLRDRLNETVAVSIWRDRGPFFVSWEKSNKIINVGLGVGSYVPLYTATGKIFRAFLPTEMTESVYQSEVAAGHIDKQPYDEDIGRVAQERVAVTQSSLVSGVAAVSTPIFGSTGQLVAALSVIGVLGYLDQSLEGLPSLELRQAAADISRSLGYKG
jgi:DNA-binding IclR family transcriptional regulator